MSMLKIDAMDMMANPQMVYCVRHAEKTCENCRHKEMWRCHESGEPCSDWLPAGPGEEVPMCCLNPHGFIGRGCKLCPISTELSPWDN